jgi:hypothetical protein
MARKSKIKSRSFPKNKSRKYTTRTNSKKHNSKKHNSKKHNSKRVKKSTFRVNQETQQRRIEVKQELALLQEKRRLLVARGRELDNDKRFINDLETSINNFHTNVGTYSKELEDRLYQLGNRQLTRLREQLIGNDMSWLDAEEQEDKEELNKRQNYYQTLEKSMKDSIRKQRDQLDYSQQKHQDQMKDIQQQIQEREEIIEKLLEQAVQDEIKEQQNIEYQTPPQEILKELTQKLDDLNYQQVKLQRRGEHALRKSGEFIFDYDNMCNNIGLIDNITGQLEVYNELKHFAHTGQISNNDIIPIEEYGIFNNFEHIPELKEIRPSPLNQLVLRYGNNQLNILIPADPNNLKNPLDPNHILGQGSFGTIYQGLLNNDPIIIKKLRNIDILGLATETIIQAHLYCKYNDISIRTGEPDIAKIPKIVSIGKIKNKYLIGMEKLDGNLGQYIKNIFTPIQGQPLTQKQAKTSVKRVQKAIIFIQNFLSALWQLKDQFMHRDLHCGNVMYKTDSNGKTELYLIDFGMSVLIDRGITNNGNAYPEQTTINRSHDLRMLISNIIEIIPISHWDLVPNYARNIAKRFSFCVMNYYMPRKNKNIFHSFYSQVINEYDWRFDFQLLDNIYNDFNDMPDETTTPTPEQIASIPDDPDNNLLKFVKRYYTY